MPLFMDIHVVPGVKARDVAYAHELDLVHEHSHSCTCMTYWVDENRGNVFCLIEAPDKNAVVNLHQQAHGLIPSKVIEVDSSVVSSFLGRIYDPETAVRDAEGLKIFEDPSFRILLLTQTEDLFLLANKMGDEKSAQLLQQYNSIIRKKIAEFNGREAENKGTGFIVSFSSAKQAVSCSMAIQSEILLLEEKLPGFKMGIHAGEPVEERDTLFGDTIQTAKYLCIIARENQVAISSKVQELVAKEQLAKKSNHVCALTPQDERMLQLIFKSLEENWQDPDFNIEEYCHTVTMSKSQLYRKTISLTGQSPNNLLKDFRLEKAKDLLKEQRFSISQITFDAGFSSPSYFTKCFKKKYGILPMAYLELLH